MTTPGTGTDKIMVIFRGLQLAGHVFECLRRGGLRGRGLPWIPCMHAYVICVMAMHGRAA